MKRYTEEQENAMQLYFNGLSQKDKRHYAAIEAGKLPYGGKKYIGDLLGISQSTIRQGETELQNPNLYKEIPIGKQRRRGGGRKKKKRVLQK